MAAADDLYGHLNRRIAVAGDVLNASAQIVRIPNPRHGAIVAHSQQDPAAQSVRQRHHLAAERRRQTLLELQRRAFTFLEQDLKIGLLHPHILEDKVLRLCTLFSLGATS